MKKKIEAAFFDADGTLFDTEKFYYLSWKEALKKYNADLTIEIYNKYSGIYFEGFALKMLEEFNLSKVVKNELMENKMKISRELITPESVKLNHFVVETLNYFRSRNLKIGLVTSADEESARLKLKAKKLLDYFEVIVAKNHVENKKPHPEPYLLAAKKLRVEPEKSLAFEDTISGALSATRAGMEVFAVPNEFSRNQDFSKIKHVHQDLETVLTFVRENVSFID